MTLSAYHQKYSAHPDADIQSRADEKEAELESIFSRIGLKTNGEEAKLAVMGSGDVRFIEHHRRIFEKFVKRPVEVFTLDVTIEHLAGGENVIQHDCTQPLPGGPYDITYAHILLKFIETEKQWDLIKNSYDALKDGGLAIHLMNEEDFLTKGEKLADGYWTVPLEKYKAKMNDEGIKFIEVPIKYGLALILQK